ncbi:MAG: hypothetical protein WB950_07415, partial [Acidobacteriaceae bacterium]
QVQRLGVTSTNSEIRSFRGECKRRGTTNSFTRRGNNGDTISEPGFHRVSIKINSVSVLLRRDVQPS